MILAGIDIGTNTIRLLVADVQSGSFRELSSARTITRLGQGLEQRGTLSSGAEERSLAAIAEFADQARRHSASSIDAVGTSALRKAANAASFVRSVLERTGVAVRIISGEEEARLTLLGVRRALGRGNDARRLDSAVVIDIGGGSTEVIRTQPSSETAEKSLPLGAVYLTERFIRHDPPRETEISALKNTVREELDRLGMAEPGTSLTLVGTAGTVTTLAAIEQEMVEYDPERINGSLLPRESLDRLIRKISAATLAERRTLKGLEQGREDIILAGAIIAREIMERLGSMSMLVSDWGLREGIVLDMFEKQKAGKTFRASTAQ